MIFLIELGEAFSEDFRHKFANRNIIIGSVLKIFVEDTSPPKEKRVVIIGMTEDKLYFGHLFFNSKININIFKDPHMKKLHILFKSEKCDFLEYDSYLDCSQIYIKKTEEIKKIIADKPDRILGKLTENQLTQVREMVTNAKTIPNYTKRFIGLKQ